MQLTKYLTPLSFSFLLPLFLVAGSPLEASMIQYQATNPGSGDWDYTYTLSGFDLTANEFIAIYFDIGSDSNLDPSPVSPNPDWLLQVFQPDPGIPADGELDLIAGVDSPSLSGQFTETFSFSGSGTPGSQSFTVYDADFNDIFDGQTASQSAAQSPEPSTLLLLLAAGLVGLAMARWKARWRRLSERTLPLVCLLAAISVTARAEIRITGQTLISSARVSQTNYNYTYLMQVQNMGTAATSVSAVATSFAPATSIVQGNVSFPDIPAGGTATSSTTITISQNRTAPIDWSLIRFAFSGISAPVANAGPDQFILPGEVNNTDYYGTINPPLCCKLNARDSYDPFGLPLSYNWTIISRPPGSNATFPTGGTSTGYVSTDFFSDVPGDYVVQLVVYNGHFNSAPSLVHLSTNGVPPKADAGWNKTIKAGQIVQLDGSHSVNPMNRPLTYAWSFLSSPAGSNPVLSDSANPRPTFTASLAGTYTLQLQVTDGAYTGAPATVTFTTGNTPPRADAGPDLHISKGSLGFLSANRSTDVDGDFLTYRWALLSAPSGWALDSVPNPDFSLASGFEVVHAQLFVSDGHSESISTVLISGESVGYLAFPIGLWSVLPAIATVAPHGPAPSAYTLDATASVSSDITSLQQQLGYWTLRESPAGSSAVINTSGGSNLTATVTPDQNGLYIAQVQYFDTFYLGYPTAISFLTHGDLPVANPGSTQFGLWTGPALHTLNGSASYDPDGAPLTYHWSLLSRPSGSTAALSSATIAAPTFTADADGTYIFQLIVNNGQADSLPATVSIIAKDIAAPVAFDVSLRMPWRTDCTPIVMEGDDAVTWATEFRGQILSLPTSGFLAAFVSGAGSVGGLGTDLLGWGADPGLNVMNPSGLLAAKFACYVPFSQTYTGFDSFTFNVSNRGYPAGCTTPGNYCIAPKSSSPATVSIQIFQN
jgi:hypothetical protein